MEGFERARLHRLLKNSAVALIFSAPEKGPARKIKELACGHLRGSPLIRCGQRPSLMTSLARIFAFVVFVVPFSLQAGAQQPPSPKPATPETERPAADSEKDKVIEKKEQSQRALVVPMFGVTNRQDAPALKPGEKFHLFARSAFPATVKERRVTGNVSGRLSRMRFPVPSSAISFTPRCSRRIRGTFGWGKAASSGAFFMV